MYLKLICSLVSGDAPEVTDQPREPFAKPSKISDFIPQTDAHNLHQALLTLEESVLRFMSDPDVSFTNNTGEQKIRMSKVKIKVSGCFRTEFYARAWCRISSYLDFMKGLGYNLHDAIQIAFDGKALDVIKEYVKAA